MWNSKRTPSGKMRGSGARVGPLPTLKKVKLKGEGRGDPAGRPGEKADWWYGQLRET